MMPEATAIEESGMDNQPLSNSCPLREYVIELTLPRPAALFDSAAAPPYGPRNLDRRVHEYFLQHISRLPRRQALRLVLYVPADETAAAAETFQSLRESCDHLSQAHRRKVRGILREGRFSLLVGLVFLIVVNAVAEGIIAATTGRLMHGIASGLEIFGWVAMWRPAELLLYDWIPVRRQAWFWSRLARMHMESRAMDHATKNVQEPHLADTRKVAEFDGLSQRGNNDHATRTS
jgi:hypothetical protein